MKHLLAKSGKRFRTIEDHTDDVCLSYRSLFGQDAPNDLFLRCMRALRIDESHKDRLFEDGLVACRLHDVGKSFEHFQHMLNGNKVQSMRHELGSIFVATRAGAADRFQDWPLIAAAIIGHHLKVSKTGDNLVPGRFHAGHGEISRTLSSVGLNAISDFDMTSTQASDERRKLLRMVQSQKEEHVRREMTLLRLCLIAADSAGSGLFREGEDIASWLFTMFLPISESAMAGAFDKQLNEMQAAARGWPDRLMLISGCGTGKTGAAWEWLKGRVESGQVTHTFFLYPVISALAEGFKNYGSRTQNAAMASSTAEFDLIGMFDDGRSGQDFYGRQRLFSLRLWPMANITATFDQVIGITSHNYGAYCLFPAIAGGAVVVDEAHACSPSMHKGLLTFLKALNVPVLLMTASMPPVRGEQLSRAVDGNVVKPQHDMIALPRYSFKFCTRDESEKAIAKAAKIGPALAIRNQVNDCIDTAQRLGSERAYHSRYRRADRKLVHDMVVETVKPGNKGLTVTTQTCELSLDISSMAVSDAASTPAGLTQRAGRSNRSQTPTWDAGRIFVFDDVDKRMPYSDLEVLACVAMVRELETMGTISQKQLVDIMEKYDVTAGASADKPFLSPVADANDDPFREDDGYTVTAVLDSDMDEYERLFNDRDPMAKGLEIPTPYFAASDWQGGPNGYTKTTSSAFYGSMGLRVDPKVKT